MTDKNHPIDLPEFNHKKVFGVACPRRKNPPLKKITLQLPSRFLYQLDTGYCAVYHNIYEGCYDVCSMHYDSDIARKRYHHNIRNHMMPLLLSMCKKYKLNLYTDVLYSQYYCAKAWTLDSSITYNYAIVDISDGKIRISPYGENYIPPIVGDIKEIDGNELFDRFEYCSLVSVFDDLYIKRYEDYISDTDEEESP